MSKKTTITAVRLRLILSVLLVVILGGTGALATVGYGILSDRAAETNEVVLGAATSEERIMNIQRNATYINENRNIVDRAKQVVAESQSYAYQDVIINDLRNIAQRAGVSILNFDFSSSSGSAETQPQADAVPEEGMEEGIENIDAIEGEMGPEMDPSATSSLKTSSVNITLRNPVEYSRLLNFLYHIEQNLTKMQVSRVGLSRATEGGRTQVTTDSLTIEVFIR